MPILAVLMQELQSNKAKLLEFQTAYQAQCKVLGLTPTDVLSYPVGLLSRLLQQHLQPVSPAAKFTDVKEPKRTPKTVKRRQQVFFPNLSNTNRKHHQLTEKALAVLMPVTLAA